MRSIFTAPVTLLSQHDLIVVDGDDLGGCRARGAITLIPVGELHRLRTMALLQQRLESADEVLEGHRVLSSTCSTYASRLVGVANRA